MSRAASLSSINCTDCGAGLSVLGGGRVTTHVCGYCGAVLDAQDAYKVLQKLNRRDHPSSPVKIGDTLTLDGVAFTVIGTLGMREAAGGYARWTEHQLYSPTHGYAWLSLEGGHFLFTRKLREMPSPGWMTPAQIEAAETPPLAWHDGTRYRYYESGAAEIDFMEGEFNWRPEMGEKSPYVTLMSHDALLTYSTTGSEREVERSTLLDRDEIMGQIGQDPGPGRPGSPHPLAAYAPYRDETFMRNALFAFAAIALLLSLWFGSFGNGVAMNRTVDGTEFPASFPIRISNRAQLVQVMVGGTGEAIGPSTLVTLAPAGGGDPVFRAGPGLAEGGIDMPWETSQRRAAAMFRPATGGAYEVTVDFSPDVNVAGSPAAAARYRVEVNERLPSGRGLFWAAILFAIGGAYFPARRMLHQRRRWSGSDWTDED